MKNATKTICVFLSILLLSPGLWAQKPGWKQETTKDGRVTVDYRFSESVDQYGGKYNVLEYEAVTNASASLESLKADIVTRYKLEENPSGKRFVFTGSPAPDMYPEGKVPRMRHNQTKYTFSDKGNGIIEIVMYSKSVPLVSVPNWLVSAWFPDGPADMLNGIIDLASNKYD